MTDKKKDNAAAPLWGWVWVGGAEFVPGLPARDIPRAEAEANDWIKTLEKAPVYERAFAAAKDEG